MVPAKVQFTNVFEAKTRQSLKRVFIESVMYHQHGPLSDRLLLGRKSVYIDTLKPKAPEIQIHNLFLSVPLHSCLPVKKQPAIRFKDDPSFPDP